MYKVAVCDSDGITIEKITVQSLLRQPANNENIPEWIYAMRDISDDVLDLKLFNSMAFQPNRDQSDSKGIIYRCR
jgi:two-component sensor histidine kinase